MKSRSEMRREWQRKKSQEFLKKRPELLASLKDAKDSLVYLNEKAYHERVNNSVEPIQQELNEIEYQLGLDIKDSNTEEQLLLAARTGNLKNVKEALVKVNNWRVYNSETYVHDAFNEAINNGQWEVVKEIKEHITQYLRWSPELNTLLNNKINEFIKAERNYGINLQDLKKLPLNSQLEVCESLSFIHQAITDKNYKSLANVIPQLEQENFFKTISPHKLVNYILSVIGENNQTIIESDATIKEMLIALKSNEQSQKFILNFLPDPKDIKTFFQEMDSNIRTFSFLTQEQKQTYFLSIPESQRHEFFTNFIKQVNNSHKPRLLTADQLKEFIDIVPAKNRVEYLRQNYNENQSVVTDLKPSYLAVCLQSLTVEDRQSIIGTIICKDIAEELLQNKSKSLAKLQGNKRLNILLNATDPASQSQFVQNIFPKEFNNYFNDYTYGNILTILHLTLNNSFDTFKNIFNALPEQDKVAILKNPTFKEKLFSMGTDKLASVFKDVSLAKSVKPTLVCFNFLSTLAFAPEITLTDRIYHTPDYVKKLFEDHLKNNFTPYKSYLISTFKKIIANGDKIAIIAEPKHQVIISMTLAEIAKGFVTHSKDEKEIKEFIENNFVIRSRVEGAISTLLEKGVEVNDKPILVDDDKARIDHAKSQGYVVIQSYGYATGYLDGIEKNISRAIPNVFQTLPSTDNDTKKEKDDVKVKVDQTVTPLKPVSVTYQFDAKRDKPDEQSKEQTVQPKVNGKPGAKPN